MIFILLNSSSYVYFNLFVVLVFYFDYFVEFVALL
jgi:hypothetical protein